MKHTYPAFPEQEPSIDLTSMLDVVFIMLIFFVVTASFIKEAGVAVNSPPASSAPPTIVESIVVVVEPAGIFNVNGRLLSEDSLAPYVRALYADNPDAPYSVLVEKDAKVGDTVVAVDAGRLLGIDVVPIAKAEL